MSKVQILLSKDLVIHLSKDEKVELKAGINEVDSELAEHWYVAAHSQPITSSDLETDGLKKQLEDVQAELATATTQLDEANKTITTLQADAKKKDTELAGLKKQLEASSKEK
ncbi:STY1053 family phage-associated protein [Acinetobacter sp. HY1485]|uniref:STY1053 family phage-associated protein n=1 Tax=Acinetobacter sp. HY1485 TaxID=2970918 RepID=UPI0022B97C93|nr:hypothetical protein [Acinetobacter sp. HY1485]